MAGSTPNLGLYLPGGGSTALIMPDETADIDTLNENFRKLDTAVGDPTKQNRHWARPAADLAGIINMKRGDTFTATDTEQVWRFDGSNWVTGENGMWKVRPTTVSGNTGTVPSVGADGSILFGTGTAVQVNGVFSPKFKRYKIAGECAITAANGLAFQYVVGTTPDAAASYAQQTFHGAGAVAAAAASAGQTQLSGVMVAAFEHIFEADIFAPADASRFTKHLFTSMDVNSGNGVGLNGGAYLVAKAHDGFRLTIAGGGSFQAGELAVYGLA